MVNNADARRRWLGMFFLAIAAGLLVWGQTVLKEKLHGVVFMVYWFVCLGCTVAAVVVALRDLRVMRAKTRQEHRELLERTLTDLEREAPPPDKPQRPPNGEKA